MVWYTLEDARRQAAQQAKDFEKLGYHRCIKNEASFCLQNCQQGQCIEYDDNCSSLCHPDDDKCSITKNGICDLKK